MPKHTGYHGAAQRRQAAEEKNNFLDSKKNAIQELWTSYMTCSQEMNSKKPREEQGKTKPHLLLIRCLRAQNVQTVTLVLLMERKVFSTVRYTDIYIDSSYVI